MTDTVRVLRVVEYTGDRKLVEQQIERSLHGTLVLQMGSLVIRAATIGAYPEILATAPTEVPTTHVDLICKD